MECLHFTGFNLFSILENEMQSFATERSYESLRNLLATHSQLSDLKQSWMKFPRIFYL